SCVDTDSSVVRETDFSRIKEKQVYSFVVAGVNSFYKIDQSSPMNTGLYSTLTVTRWDGKTEPKVFTAPGPLNGKIRYAIANDEDLYFLVDREVTEFSEGQIYAARHALLRFNISTGILMEIPYLLSAKRENAGTSFWAPLRIGKDFTEWYRTMSGKIFDYEIVRLDASGRLLFSRIVHGVNWTPDFVPEFSDIASNIFREQTSLALHDSATKQTMYSLLTVAPLTYMPQTDQYFALSHFSSLEGTYARGIHVLLLNTDLSTVLSYNHKFLIQGGKLAQDVGSFATASVNAAFSADSTIYLQVVYKKLTGKVVARKSYAVRNGEITEFTVPFSLVASGGYLYPGFDADQKLRAEIKDVKAKDLDEARFVYTGKWMVYFIPSRKEENVFFIKN
ncbi:MAG TPA: hypothetical protein VK826_03510, partial [Bacteroidia bacterium]|nr:hypothetical protein [Bacteroidia bacterium]